MKKYLLTLALIVGAFVVSGQINYAAKGFISYNVTDTAAIQATRVTYQTAYGNAGLLYFDKGRNKWRIWSGSAYKDLPGVSGGGSGTVTSVSVASANGLAGTVATATTVPAITLSTTVNGMVKGNGTALSTATAGTDYQLPITVSNGLVKTVNDISLSSVYVVTTVAALQTYIAGLGNVPVNIYFPPGTYPVTTPLTIATKQKVTITGDNAILTCALTATGSVIAISSVTDVLISNIKIDMNNNAQTSNGISITSVVGGSTRLVNIDITNLNSINNIGFNLVQVGAGANLAPGFVMTGCNVSNTPIGGTFNYQTAGNSAKGVGVKLSTSTEYFKISDCTFTGIGVGVWLANGANGLISNCVFTGNLPYVGSTKYGTIYIENTAANVGKLSVTNSKFNHNWAHAIYGNTTTLGFPAIEISNSEFITNAITPIRLDGGVGALINGNNFRTSNNATVALNNPFVSGDYRYISLVNQTNTLIQNNNFYAGIGAGEPAISSVSASDGQIIRQNNYDPSLIFTSLVGTTNIVMMNERKLTLIPTTTLSGLNIGTVAGNPSTLSDGDLWVNSSAGHIYSRIGGVSYQLDQQSGSISGLTTGLVPIATSSTTVGNSTISQSGNTTTLGTAATTGSQTITSNGTTATSINITAKGANSAVTVGSDTGSNFNFQIQPASGNTMILGLTSTTHTITGGTEGSSFIIRGQVSATTGVKASDLNLESGTAGIGNANGGNVNITPGAGVGTGTAGYIVAGAGIKLKAYTVATLPTYLPVGSIAYVTDAAAPTYLTIVVGGGAIVTPVFYNGVNWVAH
jgi:hypothetical protein